MGNAAPNNGEGVTHTTNGVAPFLLTTFEEASGVGALVAAVVSDHTAGSWTTLTFPILLPDL